MKVWTFQKADQKRTLGDKAPWHVGYYDLDGKRRKKLIGSKSRAEKVARKIEGQLADGTFCNSAHKQWAEFRAEYEAKELVKQDGSTREATLQALGHFERLVKPCKMTSVRTQAIAEYIAKRSVERGRKQGSKVSPATVNKELRHLKTVLRVARDWKYLIEVPKIKMVKEPKKLPRYRATCWPNTSR